MEGDQARSIRPAGRAAAAGEVESGRRHERGRGVAVEPGRPGDAQAQGARPQPERRSGACDGDRRRGAGRESRARGAGRSEDRCCDLGDAKARESRCLRLSGDVLDGKDIRKGEDGRRCPEVESECVDVPACHRSRGAGPDRAAWGDLKVVGEAIGRNHVAGHARRRGKGGEAHACRAAGDEHQNGDEHRQDEPAGTPPARCSAACARSCGARRRAARVRCPRRGGSAPRVSSIPEDIAGQRDVESDLRCLGREGDRPGIAGGVGVALRPVGPPFGPPIVSSMRWVTSRPGVVRIL